MASGNQNNNTNRLDSLFRDKLQDFEAPPSDGLWDAVANETHGQKAATNRKDWLYAVAALILLLITSVNLSLLLWQTNDLNKLSPTDESAFSLFEQSPEQQQLNILSHKLRKMQNNDLSGKDDDGQNLPEHNAQTSDSVETKSNQVSQEEEAPASSTSSSQRKAAISNRSQSNEKRKISQSESVTIHNQNRDSLPVEQIPKASLALLESEYDMSIAEVEQDMNKKNVEKQLRNELLGVEGFHVGAGGAFHNSWVLMDPQSEQLNFLGNNINYKFDYGYSYGFSLGYDFSTEFGVQTGFTITSKQGQTFSHELNGQRINSEIDMTYMRVPMLVKYKWSRMASFTQQPVVLNSVFGFQFNRMRSATVYNGGEKLRGERKFSSTDLGLVLGFSYDIFLSDKYYITVGARGSLSSDVNSFPALFSSERVKSEKALIGVSLSVNRLFPTKNHND